MFLTTREGEEGREELTAAESKKRAEEWSEMEVESWCVARGSREREGEEGGKKEGKEGRAFSCLKIQQGVSSQMERRFVLQTEGSDKVRFESCRVCVSWNKRSYSPTH